MEISEKKLLVLCFVVFMMGMFATTLMEYGGAIEVKSYKQMYYEKQFEDECLSHGHMYGTLNQGSKACVYALNKSIDTPCFWKAEGTVYTYCLNYKENWVN